METTETKCLSVEGAKGDSELWHKRLGHVNFISLGHLSSKKLVYDISKIVKPWKSCEMCLNGKQPRLPFASEVASRVKHDLEVVCSDVCGPFEVLSLEGNKYFGSFVDKLTRMTWVSLIKFKHEVFG